MNEFAGVTESGAVLPLSSLPDLLRLLQNQHSVVNGVAYILNSEQLPDSEGLKMKNRRENRTNEKIKCFIGLFVAPIYGKTAFFCQKKEAKLLTSGKKHGTIVL